MVGINRTATVVATTAFLSASSVFASAPAAEDLRLQVTAEGNINYFLRDETTAAQVLFTDTKNATSGGIRRFLTAFPAGNSGQVTYFHPLNDTSDVFTVSLVNGTLKSETGDHEKVGVKGAMEFSKDSKMGVTVMGATRAVRDYVEGRGVMHEIFNYTLSPVFNESYFQLNRKWINSSKTMDLTFHAGENLRFAVTPSSNGYTPPTIEFLRKGAGPGYANWSVLLNETSLTGLPTTGLFLAENATSTYNFKGSGSDPKALANALHGLNNGTNPIAKQISFLTYADKFTAGGFRFLTYFGRDTLFSLRLLMPLLQTEAIESALGSVIARTNPIDGGLCHEETIGDYASFVNINNNESYKGDEANFDYKMVDTDMLLLPVLSHYFLELPQGKNRAAVLLNKTSEFANGTTYAKLLDHNIQRVFNLTTPFAKNPVAENLIAFKKGIPVGNWRDSNAGNGWGTVAFDNNVAYAPACLRAIQALSEAGIIDQSLARKASTYASVWESKAETFFKTTVDYQTSEKRLHNFIQAANLTEGLLYGEGSLNSTNTSTTTRRYPVATLKKQESNTTFYSISRNSDSQIQVLNSDLGFALLLRTEISSDLLRGVVTALQPFPRGLLTNIGMLISNPAYSSNTSDIPTFSPAAYHGTVVWSFQQAIMAAGIQRQLNFCGGSVSSPQVDFNKPPSKSPVWCKDKQLVKDLKDAQMRLWQGIKGVADETLFSELWSYTYDKMKQRFEVIGLGALAPEGTEADAIQLWSFTFLALADPRSSTATGRV
ncbi:hypothetical protein BZA77DRAFT_320925 [Pyronema omphalodes]|nr:hypothetical protein BZA77DRAFT_320925 [Pyronema omphalodes]